jgi:hypothetical protein
MQRDANRAHTRNNKNKTGAQASFQLCPCTHRFAARQWGDAAR